MSLFDFAHQHAHGLKDLVMLVLFMVFAAFCAWRMTR